MQGNGSKTVKGVLREVIFRRRDFVVGVVDINDSPFMINPSRFVFPKGGDITTGQMYLLHGKLLFRRARGLQFLVYHHEPCIAERTKVTFSTPKPLLQALAEGEVPSIGANTGKRLVEGFGADLFTMQDPSALTSMTGIGERKAISILANIRRYLDGTHR